MKRKFLTLLMTFVMVISCAATVFATDTVTINVTDEPQVGVIEVLLSKVYDEKSTYPLSGAVFEVKHYANTDGNTSGTALHTWYMQTTALPGGGYGIDGTNPTLASGRTSSALIPDGNLKHVWPLGTYSIKEITPPTSYLVDGKTHKVVVDFNANGGKHAATVSYLKQGDNNSYVKVTNFREGNSIKDDNIFAGNISAVKKDAENNEASPQGDASLSGIKFALVLRSQDEYCLRNNLSRLVKQGEVVQVFTTDEKGEFSMTGNNLRYGTYELIELRQDSQIVSGDMYDTAIQNETKRGTSIYANNNGYLFDNQKATKSVSQDLANVTFDFSNNPVRGGVHVYKGDTQTKKVAQGDATLAGIKFAIVNRSTNKVKVDGTNYNNGQVVKIITTNAAGEAQTTNETLPYGSYSLIELRADSTIAVGDVYDSSSSKYGSSIYANNAGIAGALENNYGSMLFAAYKEDFSIRNQHEMVGDGVKLDDAGVQVTFEDARAHLENDAVRGDFEAYKVDKETMISYALDGASLADIEFTLKNASKAGVFVRNSKYPDGHVYAPGEVIHTADGKDVWVTDGNGRIKSSNKYLPYGTYTLQETKTNDSYHLTDGQPHTFTIRTEKEVVCHDDNNLIEKKEEAQALQRPANKNLIFPDQVKRGPFRFQKKDENGELLAHIPWKITNTKTGEVHYVMTDANGEFFSDKVAHSVNTNAYDDIFASYAESGQSVPASVTEAAAQDYRYNVGMWFSQSQDMKTNAPVDDDLGAFPYGWYTMEEMRCAANEGKELIVDEFFIYSDDGADLGTLDNEPIDLKTQAKDAITRTNVGAINANDRINDHVDYYGLMTDRTYKLVAELHYAKGEEGEKLDGGIIKDKNGTEVKAVKTIKPTTRDGYTSMDLVLDSRELYADGELLEGPDTVVFEYLYEIKDDGTEIFRKAHIDPNDEDQTIKYPWIGTTLVDEQTELRMGFAREKMVLIDHIEYKNFPIGTKYEFEGYLVDKATGEPALDAKGNPIENKVSKRIQEPNGVVDMVFEFDGSNMEGKTLVAFEAVDGSYVSIEHFDLDDVKQNLHVPKIRTQAKDKDTQDDVGKVVGTFVDTITYENVLPNLEYKMSGELMFKDNGKSSNQKGDKNFTAQAGADPDRADGSITVDIPLTLTKEELEGRSLVAFEELLVLANQEDGKPKKDTVVAEHKELDDKGQTVNYPKIRTIAADIETADHVGTVESEAKVIDTVKYWNLVEGREYTIKGTLYDADTNNLIATANDYTFTATAEDVVSGEKKIEFSLDSSALDGHTVVVFEKLIHNDVEVTQHEENQDEEQRVHYPWIHTTAIDSETRDHVGTILGKLINAARRLTGQEVDDTVYQKVIDKVEYKNTIPSEAYTFSGVLMNKETGEPILDENGQKITATKTIAANAHQADGFVELEFSVDSSRIQNVTIVCYEKLLHQNPETKEDIEVNRHEDINDEEQSVHDVEIHTTAIDMETGDHVGYTLGTAIIQDEVELKNLVVGMEYTLTGTLYNKDTGAKILDAQGQPYTSTLTFTAEGASEGDRVDTTKTLTFEVDGTLLEDVTVVAFEDLYHNNIRITTHSDLNDEEQSVHFPKVQTLARDGKTLDHVGTVGTTETVIDKVELKNLIPGMKYTVSGKLMIFGTTNPLLDANGQEITATKDITADAEDMVVELTFNVDSSIYRGVTTVAFEKLYHPYENTGELVEVANHEEPNDEAQSVHWPELKTHAIDKDTGGHVGNISDKAYVKDKVSLNNLIPGMDYTISGKLYYQNDVKDDNGNVIHKRGDVVQRNGVDVAATFSFTAEQADEEHVLTFAVDSTLLEGATVVAFEKLYHPENNVGTLVEVVQHEDLDDEEQSVHYPKIGTLASDGLTADHVGATEQNTIKDTVEYQNLIPGQKYKLKGTVMNKATGEALVIDGNNVIADTGWFTADTVDGTKEIVFNIDASALDGQTVVVYEKLYTPQETDWTDTDIEPIVEVEITNHEDITDEGQSIHYPKVTTNARDNDTGDHVGKVSANEEDTAQVKDNVTLENLIPGMKYTVRGRLMKHGTTQPVLDNNGNEILAQKEFVATSEVMTFDMEFDKYDSSIVRGQTTVVFEYLYHENPETEVEVEVATHEEPNDEAQSVHYPKIRTIAVDTETGDHVGSIFGRLINAFRRALGEDVADDRFAGIRDTVMYENLIPGMSYTVEGKLVNKATGEFVKDSEGKEIVSSTTFTPTTADGEVEVLFDVDTSFLQDTIIVCFEKLYHNDVEVDRHEDIEDDDQSVYEAEIKTTAKDVNTENHIGMASGETTIVDAVIMKGLRKDAEYTVNGTLYDQSTEQPLLDEAGQPYTATTTFTATDYEMTVDLTFVVNGKFLEGTTAVAFEELWHNDKKISVHSDIHDEEQSIHFPKIRTILTDENKLHIAMAGEIITVTDVVQYENLIADKECTIRGTLMDKATGEPVLQDGQPVTAEIKFTPTEPNGTVELPFSMEAMPDTTTVAFEELWYPVERQPETPPEGEAPVVEPTVEEVLIAYHKDINDEEQSIHVPEVWTVATLKNKVVYDEITYRNLIPGEYIARGWLVNTKNGKKLKKSDGEKRFTLSEYTEEGSVEVKLPVTGFKQLGGYSLTAFEELYIVTTDENGEEIEVLVAEHKDVEDKDQTVKIPKTPKTGDNNHYILYGLVLMLSFCLVVITRKFRRK